METRAGYVVVGAFVLALFVGGMAMAIWLGGLRLDQETRPFHIYFEGSVTGLNNGSPVRYRGVPVGSVTNIRVDPENVERIAVTIEVDAEVPIKSDMYAVLEAQGLTGIGYIQIQGGSQTASERVAEEGQKIPAIPSRQSALAQVFATAPQIADQMVVLMARLQTFLDPDNEQALRDILGNLATVTALIARRSDEIEQAIVLGAQAARDVSHASAEILPLLDVLQNEVEAVSEDTRATLATLRGTASGLDSEIGGLAVSLNETSDRIGATATQLENLVAETRPGVRDFANTGLYELTQFLVEARALVDNLDKAVHQLNRDPGQFLFGDRDGQVEAQ
ncbi:MAG: MCE family protein [Alphaproteobacteria bacterium]|nr:MCE family protein [Alphaproteobacteria bacterium]